MHLKRSFAAGGGSEKIELWLNDNGSAVMHLYSHWWGDRFDVTFTGDFKRKKNSSYVFITFTEDNNEELEQPFFAELHVLNTTETINDDDSVYELWSMTNSPLVTTQFDAQIFLNYSEMLDYVLGETMLGWKTIKHLVDKTKLVYC